MSPTKHRDVWLQRKVSPPRKCDYWTDGRDVEQSDPYSLCADMLRRWQNLTIRQVLFNKIQSKQDVFVKQKVKVKVTNLDIIILKALLDSWVSMPIMKSHVRTHVLGLEGAKFDEGSGHRLGPKI